MPQQVQTRKIQRRSTAESSVHCLVWCYCDIVFVCSRREAVKLFWSPSLEKFQHRPFSGHGGSNFLLYWSILWGGRFFLTLEFWGSIFILFLIFIVSVLCTRCYVTQAFSCKYILFFDYNLLLPLHWFFVPPDTLVSTLMSCHICMHDVPM